MQAKLAYRWLAAIMFLSPVCIVAQSFNFGQVGTNINGLLSFDEYDVSGAVGQAGLDAVICGGINGVDFSVNFDPSFSLDLGICKISGNLNYSCFDKYASEAASSCDGMPSSVFDEAKTLAEDLFKGNSEGGECSFVEITTSGNAANVSAEMGPFSLASAQGALRPKNCERDPSLPADEGAAAEEVGKAVDIINAASADDRSSAIVKSTNLENEIEVECNTAEDKATCANKVVDGATSKDRAERDERRDSTNAALHVIARNATMSSRYPTLKSEEAIANIVPGWKKEYRPIAKRATELETLLLASSVRMTQISANMDTALESMVTTMAVPAFAQQAADKSNEVTDKAGDLP